MGSRSMLNLLSVLLIVMVLSVMFVLSGKPTALF